MATKTFLNKFDLLKKLLKDIIKSPSGHDELTYTYIIIQLYYIL
ncbi:MAG: hypothetical protein SOR73_11090 [Romboutsia timonensis]|nr:hypothetical protein [Romboutsia timonensis]